MPLILLLALAASALPAEREMFEQCAHIQQRPGVTMLSYEAARKLGAGTLEAEGEGFTITVIRRMTVMQIERVFDAPARCAIRRTADGWTITPLDEGR
jgi:hypothetical protein